MLAKSLSNLERFSYKAWRVHGKEDPLCLLSFNEYDYLKVIQDSEGGIRITDLAEELRVTKPSASNMVVRLEKKGLVNRIACEDDARSKRVVLSESAMKNMSLETVVYKDMAAQMTSRLNEEEAKQLVLLLEKALHD
ncbi:MarR family transcriptional regulator [Vibrio sinensis]|uniref:MarR family transcriptional regulator n=1 Tax=Vibrio sinensis TaxID=2302434 RepID=A0A3A6QDW9_9VIBR|nr:MarR family transcriptional regulator [Vibrio sinensis]RJX70467.1 MarR family transcriptional regulator [Vibrio sinensis]